MVASEVLARLMIPSMRRVKPDLLVGLKREEIRIAPDRSTPGILEPVEIYVKDRPEIVYDLSNSES